jgi:DNA excision repair protein ERCC-3
MGQSAQAAPPLNREGDIDTLVRMIAGETDRPLIVQSDGSLLIDVHNPGFEEAREAISPFAELEKSPEHIHTYRISPLSLWNAASAGIDAKEVLERLERWTRFPVPDNILFFIDDTIERFGKLVLKESEDSHTLILESGDPAVRAELAGQKTLEKYLIPSGQAFLVRLVDRGSVKQALLKIGYPVKDEAPLVDGDPLKIGFRDKTLSGYPFELRDYQREAAKALHGDGKPGSGFGTVVLPCGSGKTVVGMEVMRLMQTSTLILTTNVAAVHQWIDELIDKTDLKAEDVGEYTGDRKNIRPVTVGTYQILTWRPDKQADFPHFDLFRKHKWGLIIYDEVHLLPAPVFRVTAEIQALRRLGLTATLVREDGREEDVFSLVGPKRYDVPWRELEQKGWIAEAHCHEIRVPLPESLKIEYATADKRGKYRIASENHVKLEITKELIENHKEDHIMVIGQYLDQLRLISKELGAPLITGKTANNERERIYADFRSGKERIIVVSKVANFAIDLPDANVAIQVSGTFGSRQEEAQRLGRILRPKKRGSTFYSLVSRYTTEEAFAANRQKFLTEQGYKYQIEIWEVG